MRQRTKQVLRDEDKGTGVQGSLSCNWEGTQNPKQAWNKGKRKGLKGIIKVVHFRALSGFISVGMREWTGEGTNYGRWVTTGIREN